MNSGLTCCLSKNSSTLHQNWWFFWVIHFFMAQDKICFVTNFPWIRRHDWHQVNSISNSNHLTIWEQTSTEFMTRIQAKSLAQLLSSNNLVLTTKFESHERFFLNLLLTKINVDFVEASGDLCTTAKKYCCLYHQIFCKNAISKHYLHWTVHVIFSVSLNL